MNRVPELREIIRSCASHEYNRRNNFVGQLAEILVANKFNARRARRGTRGHDMLIPDGSKLQVKALVEGSRWKGQTACFKNYEFDNVIVILLDDEDYEVIDSWWLPKEEAKARSAKRHDRWKETGGKLTLGKLDEFRIDFEN